MTRRLLLCIALLAVCSPAAWLADPISAEPGIAPAADDDCDEDGESWHQAPDDLVRAYVEAVKTTEMYVFADGMRLEKVTPVVEEVKKEAGLQLETGSRSFLASLIDEENDAAVCRGEWTMWLEVNYRETARGEKRVLILRAENEESGEDGEWFLSIARIKELDFDVADAIQVVHPLNQRLDRYSVTGEVFTKVIRDLCGKAGVGYAVNAGEGDQAKVSLSLTDRSILETLDMAADSVDWSLDTGEWSGWGDDGAAPGDRTSRPGYWLDGWVEVSEAERLWLDREFVNFEERLSPEIETPMDALRYQINSAVRAVKEAQVVLTFKPVYPPDKR